MSDEQLECRQPPARAQAEALQRAPIARAQRSGSACASGGGDLLRGVQDTKCGRRKLVTVSCVVVTRDAPSGRPGLRVRVTLSVTSSLGYSGSTGFGPDMLCYVMLCLSLCQTSNKVYS